MTAGGSMTCGSPGTKPIATPPSTRRIGSGTRSAGASTRSPPAATSRPRSSRSWCAPKCTHRAYSGGVAHDLDVFGLDHLHGPRPDAQRDRADPEHARDHGHGDSGMETVQQRLTASADAAVRVVHGGDD